MTPKLLGMLLLGTSKIVARGLIFPQQLISGASSGLFERVISCTPNLKSCCGRFPLVVDMGVAELDDSRQIISPEQPAINTTRLLNDYRDETDVVLHIGDIAYAEGYAATVSSQEIQKHCFIVQPQSLH